METLFVGRNIIFLPEVDSTNSYAINLLKNVNVAEGSVVYAASQTSGRGQRGNTWNAEPDSNLTVSIIIKPGFLELKKQFFLYQIAALACYDVMAELLNSSQFDIKIKWPNDILINGKKAAGILIENNIFNGSINQSVVGIGINVNQVNFENGVNATSLKLSSGKVYDREEVLKILCGYFEKYYLLLKNNHWQKINENYLNWFFKKNEWQGFEIENKVKNMFVAGINENGLLLLEDENGNKAGYDIKAVKWLL